VGRQVSFGLVFVKICGITSEEDALLAVAMGADAVGFVLAPSSRQIAAVRAGDIAKRLPPEVLTVGVFRDEAPKRVVELVNKAGLKAAQLHGGESMDDVAHVREHVPVVIKAFAAGSGELARAERYKCDAIMIDSATPGSGKVFDWALAEDAPQSIRRVILAGGLHPGNVAEAIHKVKPWGVDVASGVERSPGRKDATLVRQFISAAKAAAPRRPVMLPTEDVGDNVLPYDWQEDG